MYNEPNYELHQPDLWVSEDGSYGSGDVGFFDTTDWTGKDFDRLDRASDSEKLEIALSIAKRKSNRFSKENLGRIDLRVFIIDDDGVEEIK
jgi:hypothetical protein